MESISIVTGNSGWDAISLLSLLVAIGAVIFTVYWNFRAESRGSLDEYWFRQVVAPKCVDPIISFHDSWSLKIRNLDGSLDVRFVQDFLYEFQSEKSVVLDGTWVSKIFSKTFYAECCNTLDQVEDEFADELSRAVIDPSRLPAVHVRLRDCLSNASARMLYLAAQIHSGRLMLGKQG